MRATTTPTCSWTNLYNSGYSGNARATISASTLSGNSAGGILNDGQSGTATLTVHASTFSSNPTPSIYNYGPGGSALLEIGDTILNAATPGRNIYNNSGTVTSAGYNLSSDDGGGFLTNLTDQLNADPKLGPLLDNGGPTWTHALLPGNPAIDRGKRDAITNLISATDQRGLLRSVDNPHLANAADGDASDIGAFEVQGSGGFDTDADGLPDFWELAYFVDLSQSATNDSDGDGQDNRFEFTAGLNPADPASKFVVRLENVAGQPNQRQLIFKPWASGRTYTPQFRTNLGGAAFAPLTNASVPATNGTEITITDLNATEPQKFYRIQISTP